MTPQEQVVSILESILQLSSKNLNLDTPLLGAIPEFDSMAVVSVITALEEQNGFFVDDDEIEASTFETVGTLTDFVEQKLNG